jgi:hypothetical protein
MSSDYLGARICGWICGGPDNGCGCQPVSCEPAAFEAALDVGPCPGHTATHPTVHFSFFHRPVPRAHTPAGPQASGTLAFLVLCPECRSSLLSCAYCCLQHTLQPWGQGTQMSTNTPNFCVCEGPNLLIPSLAHMPETPLSFSCLPHTLAALTPFPLSTVHTAHCSLSAPQTHQRTSVLSIPTPPL